MKESNSQLLVIFLSISLIIGCLIPGFVDNTQLVVSITVAALAFVLFDLCIFLKLNKLYGYFFLFLAIFSISVLPYIQSVQNIILKLNNFFTIIALAIVIGILGARQYLEERNFLRKTHLDLKERTKERTELIEIIREKNNEIDMLKNRMNNLEKEINSIKHKR